MLESSTAEPAVALPLVVTIAGREAAVEASNAGLQLQLTEIALGRGLWEPDATATALQDEIKRLPNLGGSDVAPDMLHLTITDDCGDEYTLGEFGLYTDTGILFAIYSQGSWISEKLPESILMLSADMKLDTVPAGSVTIEGNNFQYPPATPTSLGVINDAPNDGDPYVRQSIGWTPLVAFISGMILMWAGSEDQVPEGWQLCNGEGTTSNGIVVPNLLNRMVIGSGDSYSLGQTGGATSSTTSSAGSHEHTVTVSSGGSHSHTLTVNSTTLSISQIPSHDHECGIVIKSDVDAIYGSRGVSNGSKTERTTSSGAKVAMCDDAGSSSSHTHSASSNSTGSHTHTASTNTVGDHTHTVATLPPYYALAFIIKL